jgi:uncharacterized protein (DUF433 family)
MRIQVVDVLGLFAAGLGADQILEEMPDLEREDLQAVEESTSQLNARWAILGEPWDGRR